MNKKIDNCVIRQMIKHPFFLSTLIFLIITLPLIFLPKGTIELWVNRNNIPFLDLFFKYYTYLGDGIVYAVVFLFLIIRHYYRAIFFSVIVAFSFLVTNVLFKEFLFKDILRPYKYFIDKSETLHFIEGIKLHSYNSFPSGHTNTAFVWLGFIALLLPKKFGFPLFIMALLVAISRVYIFQHFFIDVYFGSFIGIFAIIFIKYIMVKHTNLSINPKLKNGLFYKFK